MMEAELTARIAGMKGREAAWEAEDSGWRLLRGLLIRRAASGGQGDRLARRPESSQSNPPPPLGREGQRRWARCAGTPVGSTPALAIAADLPAPTSGEEADYSRGHWRRHARRLP